MHMIRKISDRITERLVPRATAGACPRCYSPGSCGPGRGTRWCCYIGSTCRLSCGCT